MNYHERHGHDVSSFDLPSTHRLPTVSAAQALEELSEDTTRHVRTSLPDLDRALAGITEEGGEHGRGGFQRGSITELWGPPGVGKTTFGIQAAADVLRDGKSVVWVDCFHPVCHTRLTDICCAGSDNLEKLAHFICPSLAHFIALLCRPTPSSLPPDTGLIVVDSLSALINHAFPRVPAPRAASKANKKGPDPSSRRIQVLQYVIGALQKLAATRDVAVILLSQCATRMQAERGATLIPAVNANVWEQGIATRVSLFRDFMWNDSQVSGARLAAVQKTNGKVTSDALAKVYAFKIESKGLVAMNYNGIQPAVAISATTPGPKRKLGETGFEVPDSEDEFGWQEDDDSALPKPPPQWQGSEDILLGEHPETDDDNGGSADDTDVEAEPPVADEQ